MWEFERYDWERLRAAVSAARVPAAITTLLTATTTDDANAAYWKIDNEVVVQGALYESALPTTRCLCIGLSRCTSVARPHVLELLVQLAGGEPHPDEVARGNGDLDAACGRELVAISGLLFDLLERSSLDERDFCVDLLGLCARQHRALCSSVCWYFQRLAARELEPPLRQLVSSWVAELDS